jgi:hypothetical protein
MNLSAVRALIIALVVNGTQHQATELHFQRSGAVASWWDEGGVTRVCRPVEGYRFSFEGANISCREVWPDLIHVDGFGG